MKICSRCGEAKPLDDFKDVRRRGRVEKHSWCNPCFKMVTAGYYQKHKERRDAEAKLWRRNNPERTKELNRIRDQRWRSRHGADDTPRFTYNSWVYRLAKQGLTPEDYDRILAEQGGRCAICPATDPGKVGRTYSGKFAADHCHKTGQSRGLLCHKCNMGLGLFCDDPDLLLAAAKYLTDARLGVAS